MLTTFLEAVKFSLLFGKPLLRLFSSGLQQSHGLLRPSYRRCHRIADVSSVQHVAPDNLSDSTCIAELLLSFCQPVSRCSFDLN